MPRTYSAHSAVFLALIGETKEGSTGDKRDSNLAMTRSKSVAKGDAFFTSTRPQKVERVRCGFLSAIATRPGMTCCSRSSFLNSSSMVPPLYPPCDSSSSVTVSIALTLSLATNSSMAFVILPAFCAYVSEAVRPKMVGLLFCRRTKSFSRLVAIFLYG